MADYKISLGVDIKTSDIRKKISEFNGYSNKPKIHLDVKLNKSGISDQITKLKPKTPVKLDVQFNKQSIRNQLNSLRTSPVDVNINLNDRNALNQIANLRQQLQSLNNLVININGGNGGGNGGRGVSNVAEGHQRALRQVYNLYKQIEAMQLKLGKLRMSGIDSGNIAQYQTQLSQLRQTYENLLSTLSGQNGAINLDNVLAEISRARTSITELSSEVDNARTKLASSIKLDIDSGALQAKIDAVEQKFRDLGIVNQDVTRDIGELQRLLACMDASNDIESVTSDYQTFLQLLESVNNGVIGLQTQINDANRPEILSTARESAMRKLNGLFENGSQAAKRFSARAAELRDELNACGNTKGIAIVTKKINNLGQEVKNSHLQTKRFGTGLKEQFARYRNYFSIASLMMWSVQGLKSMFEQVKSIDSAMTELKKVTDETDASYNDFLTNAASKAKELGTTIDGLVESTADFARLGYGFDDAQGLAEVANIYAVVGDEIDGVEQATESLISTMAAFKSETDGISNTDFAMDIVDKFNEIGNNFAISSGGIGEALERSASSMAAANNTLDETIALVTAANTVVQDPEAVGRLMPT